MKKGTTPFERPPPCRMHAAHQAMLRWMIKSPSPIRQEVVNQLLGPVEYPLLRRSLRRLRSTQELDAFLRPVLVPGNHARGIHIRVDWIVNRSIGWSVVGWMD